MMAQFLEIKEEYKDALLFYRMGDFYELFFDDAVAASAALDIALTKRGKHLGEDIPMCGVPVHSAENYLHTLIAKGFRVAVCEQLESPEEAKKRGSKSVVKRGVVRLVTPGTLTEENLLSARDHNYLAAYYDIRGEAALAWLDMSTGDLSVQITPAVSLLPTLAWINPSELLVADAVLGEINAQLDGWPISLTPLGAASFDSRSAEARLHKLFGVTSLDGFGQFDRAELAVLGALVDYLEITQKGTLPMVKPPVKEAQDSHMQIDAATRRNLELTQTLAGARKGSLLDAIDRTVTSAGARLLKSRLTAPLRNVEKIDARLDAVSEFVASTALRDQIREQLSQVPDMDRAITRISLGRGGPRDLTSILRGLQQGAVISKHLADIGASDLKDATKALTGHGALIQQLDDALKDEVPLLARDGGFVAEGYRADLDEARALRDDGRKVISSLQAEYQGLTGITALKVKHNNVLGYFIETPATHAKKMLDEAMAETFIHRQTTANAVRFTTVPLSEMETKIHNAGGQALAIELQVFEDLVSAVLDASVQVFGAAQALAEIDVAASHAALAADQSYARPKLSKTRAFAITGGRHPIVEQALSKDASGPFIANDCDLSAGTNGDKNIWLITGPNMAGKSTFLRQNALIAILAQMGAYVPASQAEIGIVSQVFSRVGASDDLARGQSTFMVEMVETAAILNQADENALVILDEIGRGTATYDGLSIAWAVLEYLHEVNDARALFATHYHELTALTEKLPHLKNATVSVKEYDGKIIFMHEVTEGAADRSYGVQVADLAGLPNAVLSRAREILGALESGDARRDQEALVDELPLFSAEVAPSAPAANTELEDFVKAIMPDELTPRAALDLIYEIKEKLK
ncbi:MAG: DNA mismatch repair protein MutS [Pseudomonadota bacterium]